MIINLLCLKKNIHKTAYKSLCQDWKILELNLVIEKWPIQSVNWNRITILNSDNISQHGRTSRTRMKRSEREEKIYGYIASFYYWSNKTLLTE